MKTEKSIDQLEKKEKLKIVSMTKIIGGQADGGGYCIIDNIGGKTTADDGGLCIVENVVG